MQLQYGKPFRGQRLEHLRSFLTNNGLDYDDGIQFTVNLLEGDEIAATGSLEYNVIKCVAVSPDFQSEGLAATLVTELIKEAASRDIHHLFVFTKPRNQMMFGSLGFYPVGKTSEVLLMENKRDGISSFVKNLARPENPGSCGCIVANCNPFTNGHLYLVETAASRCDTLHLFVLSENRSAFPADVRIELVRQGTQHIKNVLVHPTGPYLISSATFPTYFIKDKVKAAEMNCELDLTIFAQHFAKPLGITQRFVGTEPFDPVTSSYNQQMHRYLPPLGVEVVELPRVEEGGSAVSASRVRKLLAEGKWEEIRPLVPPSTYSYLEGMEQPYGH